MWSPTHIQVTVQRAKGLLTKGKNETNNCFVTIGLGKEKYQTSIKEKAEANVSWNEECELKIPDHGNRAELVLTCLHRNNLGIDEFLGQANLPLNEMDVYDRPRSKWFKLQSKPGKEKKNKERGELEVRINFVVKSGSLTDLSKKDKHKSSVGQLASSVGGSLLSIGTLEKRKSIKKFAKSLGSKMHIHSKKKNKDGDNLSFNGSLASIEAGNHSYNPSHSYGQRAGDADPGVISEDEDEFVFDNLSHKSSGSSLNVRSINRTGEDRKYVSSNPSPLLSVEHSRWSKGKQLVENIDANTEYKNELEIGYLLPPPSSGFQDLNKLSFEEEKKAFEESFDVKKSDDEKYGSKNCDPDTITKDDITVAEVETISINDVHENNKDTVLNKDSEGYKETQLNENLKKNSIDEWESKLYLDVNKSDSLKRTSWQQARVQIPLTVTNENKRKDISDSSETECEEESIKDGTTQNTGNDNNGAYKLEHTNKPSLNFDSSNFTNQRELANTKKKPKGHDSIINKNNFLIQSEHQLLENQGELNKNLRSIILEDVPIQYSRNNVQEDSFPPKETILPKISQRKSPRVSSLKLEKGSEKQIRCVEGGHEKSSGVSRNSDLSAVLEKKYEGKSREELMFIANGMENEVLKYRQKVKELEDYLDNLLLRVMETHPKILQNPYSRTTFAKSG